MAFVAVVSLGEQGKSSHGASMLQPSSVSLQKVDHNSLLPTCSQPPRLSCFASVHPFPAKEACCKHLHAKELQVPR